MEHERRKSPPATRLLGVLLVLAAAGAAAVPPAEDLREAGRRAERGCKPLLLEFSALSCSYCRLLEDEVLNPTLLNRDYDRRVLMRKLLVDSPERVGDFDGGRITGEQLAQRYKVFVTPTLLFVDARGREIAERMVGVTTLEFYGGYLDLALDKARDRLRTRDSCP